MNTILDGAGKSRNTFLISVNMILEKENKVLLLRRTNTTWMNGFYNFPAGHIESNESPKQCAKRELEEELGIIINEGDLIYVKTIFRSGKNDDMARIDIVFSINIWKGEVNLRENNSDKILWIEKSNLPINVVPLVRIIIGKEELYQELE